MSEWRMAGEPPLEELLDDEVMIRVMRTAGLDRAALRRSLADLARRLDARQPIAETSRASECCGAGFR